MRGELFWHAEAFIVVVTRMSAVPFIFFYAEYKIFLQPQLCYTRDHLKALRGKNQRWEKLFFEIFKGRV